MDHRHRASGPKGRHYGIDDGPLCKTLVSQVLLRVTDSPTRVPRDNSNGPDPSHGSAEENASAIPTQREKVAENKILGRDAMLVSEMGGYLEDDWW